MNTNKLLSAAVMLAMLSGCAQHKYSVYFKPDSAELTKDSKRTLKEIAADVKSNNHKTINIAGYTDTVGSKDINWALATKRVDSVDTALNKLGIAEDRMTNATMAEGWFNPKNTDSETMRRVDIRIYK